MIKGLLYLALLTTATVISWIGFSIYHNHTTSTIDDATEIRITPIPGEFDREVIESIKSKKNIEADLDQPIPNASPSPTEEDEAIGTVSAEIQQ